MRKFNFVLFWLDAAIYSMARNKFILYEPLLQKYTFIPGHALKCAG